MNSLQKFLAKTFLGLNERDLERLSEGAIEYPDGNYGWKRITEKDAKGLDIITRDNQLKICFKLYLTNPLAKAMIDTINDYVFGNGFKYDVKGIDNKLSDEKLDEARAILDRFWKVNKFDLRLKKKGTDLALNGMLALPVFTNDINGEVKLGFVDPLNIKKIHTNALNVEEITAIELKGLNKQDLIKKAVLLKEDKDSLYDADFGLMDGEMFYFAVNNVSNQPEGVSDLLVTADMVDMFSQLLFNILKHTELHYLYFEDVELTGYNDAQIVDWKRKNPVGKPGSRFVHNDKVKKNLITPDIKAHDSSEIVRLFKNIALMSKRFPEHWFADGGNTNLATAVEQGAPIHKLMEERQEYWKYILTDLLTFPLHKAFNKKEGFSLTKDDLNNVEININAPEIETKNLTKAAEGVSKITKLLRDAVNGKWISQETAGKMFRTYCDILGYNVTDETEIELIAKEMKNNAEKEIEEGSEEEQEEPENSEVTEE